MLPFLQLGLFWERSLPEVLLRRALLTIRMPLEPLVAIGSVLRTGRWSLRWHRFLHTYCYWTGVQKAFAGKQEWKRFTIGVPILLYHAFDRRTGSRGPYTVSERAFRLQMRWLASQRYRVLDIDEYLGYARECIPPPARSVVITIDDGYRDNWTVAWPILRKHGFPATVFLATGYIGKRNEWDPHGELAGRPMLTWTEIQEMAAENVSFGAHTVTHPVLSSLQPDAIRSEMRCSRETLSEVLGRCSSTFSYPYGQFDALTAQIAHETGFLGACSVHRGLNSVGVKRTLALRRTTVHGTDSFLRFLFGLWTGYTGFAVPGK
jgi:peptidoglycan/xylan/chitin deacetylase (PgdA/CDA1 family)